MDILLEVSELRLNLGFSRFQTILGSLLHQDLVIDQLTENIQAKRLGFFRRRSLIGLFDPVLKELFHFGQFDLFLVYYGCSISRDCSVRRHLGPAFAADKPETQ